MIKISDGLISTSVDGETVLLDTASGKYFGLNATGSKIFEQLKAGEETTAIVSKLAKLYGIGEDRLLFDVESLVQTLIEKGLATKV